MWSHRRAPVTRQAAAFCTDCRRRKNAGSATFSAYVLAEQRLVKLNQDDRSIDYGDAAITGIRVLYGGQAAGSGIGGLATVRTTTTTATFTTARGRTTCVTVTARTRTATPDCSGLARGTTESASSITPPRPLLPRQTTTSYVQSVGLYLNSFHYTGPTGPARTSSRDPGRRPGSPTKCADFVWSGPVGPV